MNITRWLYSRSDCYTSTILSTLAQARSTAVGLCSPRAAHEGYRIRVEGLERVLPHIRHAGNQFVAYQRLPDFCRPQQKLQQYAPCIQHARSKYILEYLVYTWYITHSLQTRVSRKIRSRSSCDVCSRYIKYKMRSRTVLLGVLYSTGPLQI